MSKLNLVWLVLFVVVLLVGYSKCATKPQNTLEIPNFEPQAILQGNSFFPISSMEFPHIQVLASKISWCESRDDPTAKNPNSTAYGLCGFLDGTWVYVQNKWQIKLDRKNPDDQWYACQRLLEEEGTKHWSESEHCWSNL